MATDIFLKMSTIDGESTDDKHKGEIEVLSYAAGVTMPVSPRSTSGSATKERVSLSDMSITKLVDAATPGLFKAACSGAHLAEAVLSINRADGKGGKVEYLKYTLSDVVIANYHAAGHDGSGLPLESMQLNFGKFKVEYVPTDPSTGEGKGAKMAGWDVAASKPI